MSDLIHVGDYTANGYQPVVLSGGWRAAYLNNTEDKVSDIAYLERHTTSDELFVLVAGSCRLVASPDGKSRYEAIEMEPLKMYNVPCTTFHAVAMRPGCRILIVEDLDVGKENSEYHDLTQAEKAKVLELTK